MRAFSLSLLALLAAVPACKGNEMIHNNTACSQNTTNKLSSAKRSPALRRIAWYR